MVVASIQALLSAPNPDDPLAENIAKHWKTNEQEAVETGEYILSEDKSVWVLYPVLFLESVIMCYVHKC